MKTTFIIITVLLAVAFLVGCNGSDTGIAVGIEAVEKALSVDLDSLSDDSVKDIFSGAGLVIKYVDLEGAGALIEKDIARNPKWSPLPYSGKVKELLASSGADRHYAFDEIEKGYYTLSEAADGHTVGIWDSTDETLYYISVTTN